jgi:hypothetical protein
MIWLPLPPAHEDLVQSVVPSWLRVDPVIELRHDARRRLDEAKAGVIARALTSAALLFVALAAGAAVLTPSSEVLRGGERANATVATDPVRQLQQPAAFDPCRFVRCFDI